MIPTRHDPIVKGKGSKCAALCVDCRFDPRYHAIKLHGSPDVLRGIIAVGSRAHVNRAVQRHRKLHTRSRNLVEDVRYMRDRFRATRLR
jgi:hypothetical protein